MACSCGTCAGCAASAVAARGRPALAQRLAPTVDKLRQRLSTAGLRPYEVELVWTAWDGDERGEGRERELRRVAIRPTPRVLDLTSVSYSPYAAGILPVGSVRVEGISTQLTADNLTGKAVPGQAYFAGCGMRYPGALAIPPGALVLTAAQAIAGPQPRVGDGSLPQNIAFFYEVTQVGGGERRKFRLYAEPFLRPGKFDWTITLERISEDRDRDGRPRHPQEVER